MSSKKQKVLSTKETDKLSPLSKDKVRIFHVDGKVEDRFMTGKTFTEKFVNETIKSYFTAFEGPDDTKIFISQNENETNDVDEKQINHKANFSWLQAGHKDKLYGTVLQVPEDLCQVFFSRMQVLQMG